MYEAFYHSFKFKWSHARKKKISLKTRPIRPAFSNAPLMLIPKLSIFPPKDRDFLLLNKTLSIFRSWLESISPLTTCLRLSAIRRWLIYFFFSISTSIGKDNSSKWPLLIWIDIANFKMLFILDSSFWTRACLKILLIRIISSLKWLQSSYQH